MSLFHFTRQEQIAILFLSGGLLVGSAVTLVKHHQPRLAPALTQEESMNPPPPDSVDRPEILAPPTPAGSPGSDLLDINQANMEELIGLPGIGPKMAERIITYRTGHGPFRTLNDLKNVKGIGDKTLERLRPLLDFD